MRAARSSMMALAAATLAACTQPSISFDLDTGSVGQDAQDDLARSDMGTGTDAGDAGAMVDTVAPDAIDAADVVDVVDAGSCDAGFGEYGDACVPLPPRQITPLSTSYSPANAVTLRWQAPTSPPVYDGLLLEICSDPQCRNTPMQQRLSSNTALSYILTSQAPGNHWWRIAAALGGAPSPRRSPIWEFRTGHSPAPDGGVRARLTPMFATVDGTTSGHSHVVVGSYNNTMQPLTVVGMNSGVLQTVATINAPSGAHPGFGWNVTSAGDVNGDGHPDLLVGSCGPGASPTDAPTSGTCEGAAYLYFGGSGGYGTSPDRAFVDNGSDGYGYGIAGVGDFDGDGFGDIAIGGFNGGPEFVDLFFGGPNGPDPSAGYRFTTDSVCLPLGDAGCTTAGWQSRSYFGVSLAGADLDGDGLSDLIIGAPNLGGKGRIVVIAGRDLRSDQATPGVVTTTAAYAFEGPVNSNLGVSVSAAGDINADGFADAVATGNGDGALLVLTGGPSFTSLSPFLNIPTSPPAGLGVSVRGVGDVDGDSFDDIVVGAGNAGHAYLYHGLSMVPFLTSGVTDLAGISNFGRWIAGPGDMDNDGYADFAVSACAGSGGCNPGVWVYPGGRAFGSDAGALIQSGSGSFGGGLGP